MLLAEKYNEADLNAVRSYERNEGRAEGTLSTLVSLVSDGLISLQDGAKRADLSESEFAKYLNK